MSDGKMEIYLHFFHSAKSLNFINVIEHPKSLGEILESPFLLCGTLRQMGQIPVSATQTILYPYRPN